MSRKEADSTAERQKAADSSKINSKGSSILTQNTTKHVLLYKDMDIFSWSQEQNVIFRPLFLRKPVIWRRNTHIDIMEMYLLGYTVISVARNKMQMLLEDACALIKETTCS